MLALTNQPFVFGQTYCPVGTWQEQLAGMPVIHHYYYYCHYHSPYHCRHHTDYHYYYKC